MPCFSPLQAFYGPKRPSGKRVIVFKESERQYGAPFFIPCGRCIGCRLERSRQWAIRCMHEASLHDFNCFITLTYDNENLPESRSLVHRDFQLFMKRLRNRVLTDSFVRDYPLHVNGNGIKFYQCGEYGKLNFRPHYHACLFNFDFPDKKISDKNSNGDYLYSSDIANELWRKGNCILGSVTFESAAYVARYIVDKVNGEDAILHYVNRDTGEVLKPEYTTMSRRPSIGYDWFKLYGDDVYPSDEVIVRGRSMRPPKYYDYLLEKVSEDWLADIKAKREDKAIQYSDDQTPERLCDREKVKLAKLNMFKRK